MFAIRWNVKLSCNEILDLSTYKQTKGVEHVYSLTSGLKPEYVDKVIECHGTICNLSSERYEYIFENRNDAEKMLGWMQARILLLKLCNEL